MIVQAEETTSVTTNVKTHHRERSDCEKDIAVLYSKLQSVVTTSGNDSNDTESDDPPLDDPCSCRHFLVADVSKHCAMCDRTLPLMDEIQRERHLRRKERADMDSVVNDTSTTVAQHKATMDQLTSHLASLKDDQKRLAQKYLSVQKDMALLNDKFERERNQVASLLQSKDQAESELRDLSQRLFEEANGMVADEKRAKVDLEKTYSHLQAQLQDTCALLAEEESRLTDLRRAMAAIGDQAHTDAAQSETYDVDEEYTPEADWRATLDLACFFTADPQTMTAPVDPIALAEFTDWINASVSIPLRKMDAQPFLKSCFTEDMEPCLRFGPHSRLSARKLCDAMASQTFEIEVAPERFAVQQASTRRVTQLPVRISVQKTLLRWSESDLLMGCQACGRMQDATDSERQLVYRFRASTSDDWACVDRHCRARMVAVCELYTFLRHLQEGRYDERTVVDLYHEMLRLRLQMFHTRTGTLPIMLQSLGMDTDTIGAATPPRARTPSAPPSSIADT